MRAGDEVVVINHHRQQVRHGADQRFGACHLLVDMHLTENAVDVLGNILGQQVPFGRIQAGLFLAVGIGQFHRTGDFLVGVGLGGQNQGVEMRHMALDDLQHINAGQVVAQHNVEHAVERILVDTLVQRGERA